MAHPCAARAVLRDLAQAVEMLEDEAQNDRFRILWVGAVALARAVGHVLKKVDGEDPLFAKAVETLWASWKADPEEHAIFWEFIEQERNNVLKTYELGYEEGDIPVVAGGHVFELDENIYRPLLEGRWAGEDGRDILRLAIEWWSRQLEYVEGT